MRLLLPACFSDRCRYEIPALFSVFCRVTQSVFQTSSRRLLWGLHYSPPISWVVFLLIFSLLTATDELCLWFRCLSSSRVRDRVFMPPSLLGSSGGIMFSCCPCVRPCVRSCIRPRMMWCFRDISGTHWRIFFRLLSPVHLGRKWTGLGSKGQRSRSPRAEACTEFDVVRRIVTI